MRGQPPGSATCALPEYPPALGARRSLRPFALALESTRKKRELELVNASCKTLQVSDLEGHAVRDTGSDAWRGRVAHGWSTVEALCLVCGGASAFSAERTLPAAALVPHTLFRQPYDASTHF